MVNMQWKRAWEVLHDMGSTKEEVIVHVPIFKPTSPAKQLRIFSKKYFQRRTAFSIFIYGVGALSFVISCMLLLFIECSFNSCTRPFSIHTEKETLKIRTYYSKIIYKGIHII